MDSINSRKTISLHSAKLSSCFAILPYCLKSFLVIRIVQSLALFSSQDNLMQIKIRQIPCSPYPIR